VLVVTGVVVSVVVIDQSPDRGAGASGLTTTTNDPHRIDTVDEEFFGDQPQPSPAQFASARRVRSRRTAGAERLSRSLRRTYGLWRGDIGWPSVGTSGTPSSPRRGCACRIRVIGLDAIDNGLAVSIGFGCR
jgi:hypothetical protein